MLAADLRYALEDLGSVQSRLDDVLASLFTGWRPRFPVERGWRFVPPAELHVFEAAATADSLAKLRLLGFAPVVMHAHEALKFETCRCEAS